jgi:hypothetical protein
MTATFWGSFAAARGLAIPAAILLSPEVIMWTSLATAFGRCRTRKSSFADPNPDPDPSIIKPPSSSHQRSSCGPLSPLRLVGARKSLPVTGFVWLRVADPH